MKEPEINARVSLLGVSDNDAVRSSVIVAFTDRSPYCNHCHQTKTFGDGYHFNGDKNIPDHILACPCGVESVHEAKPRPSTAMAWNVPPTVDVLKHKSVIGLWDDALNIPETCLKEHSGCGYDHDWHGQKPALAVPQVLSYAYTFDKPVSISVDDKKYSNINTLYKTNWDDSGFLLDENWYTVKRNSDVISKLKKSLDNSDISSSDKLLFEEVIKGMLDNASQETLNNVE